MLAWGTTKDSIGPEDPRRLQAVLIGLDQTNNSKGTESSDDK